VNLEVELIADPESSLPGTGMTLLPQPTARHREMPTRAHLMGPTPDPTFLTAGAP
jgi:hypothetical protein